MEGKLIACRLGEKPDGKPRDFVELGKVTSVEEVEFNLPAECAAWEDARFLIKWEDGTATEFHNATWKPCVIHPKYGILLDGPIIGDYINHAGELVKNS